MKAPQRTIWHRLQNPQLARRVIFAILLFFSAVASFNGYFSKTGFIDNTPDTARYSFKAFIDGTARKPYIYRQLIPGIANWANKVAPPSLLHFLANVHGTNVTGVYVLFSSPESQDPVYSFRYLTMYALCVVGAILGTLFLYLVCRAEGHTPIVAVTASIVLVMLIPYIQIFGPGMFYDYPELAFLAVGVWIAQRLNWLWLVPVAVLGTMNKESYILILLTLWPLLRTRYGQLFSILQIAVLELLAIGAYCVNRLRFHGNPGGTVVFQPYGHVMFFMHPSIWLVRFGRAYGVFVPEVATLVPMAILIWLVWLGCRRFSPRIRQHALLALAINLPLYFLFCHPAEMRDFSMLYVAFMLCLANILSAAVTAQTDPPKSKSELLAEGRLVPTR